MQQKNNKDKFIKTVESAGVPGMGPGRATQEYLGLSVQLRATGHETTWVKRDV